MRILITGGAGFIGSHLCERWVGRGYTVICLDNFLTGLESNIAPVSSHPNFQLVRHDISTPFEPNGPVDYVLHLASPASPKDYRRFPLETLRVGSLGTYHTLEIAKAKGSKFLLASTSEVYGDPLVHPQPETYWGNVNPIGPRSVYDEAKRFAEAISMAYHRQHGLNVQIARIFNTFGPRMRWDDGRAIPNFITQALSGEPITVYGDGSQTRSFCYIDDLVLGIQRLMESDITEPINLGNPQEISLLALAELILRLTKSKSRIVFQPLPQDDPKLRCPEIHLAQECLHWSPFIALEEGLSRTIRWFQQQL